MLITQSELETLCLTKTAQDELAAQVINQLNGITDPLVRYATANALLNVMTLAASNAGAAAEAFCEQHDIGTDGKQFQHEGLTFSRQFIFDYNYADNDWKTDDTGKRLTIGYKDALRTLNDLKAKAKGQEKILKGKKAEIELAHPNMLPNVVRVTVKYHAKEK